MSERPLQQGEFINAIKKLLPKHSKDYHDLSMHFLKKIIATIERPLLYIFGKSLSQGVVPVPDKLKIARDCSNLTNYCPISLLCNLGKILEKIVHTRLTLFITENKLLSENQFGFRSSHSTVHPSLLLHNFITDALNKKRHAAAIFCGLSKAFDTCDHNILLKMLEKKV